MYKGIFDLTIVTITKDNPEELLQTISSCESLLTRNCKMIIQNGGLPINFKGLNIDCSNIQLYNESDNGIYDAINKGISKVSTEFFILLHSGDEILVSPDQLKYILLDLKLSGKGVSLNSVIVEFSSNFHRYYFSDNWKLWMFNFGVQPPHLGCIYVTAKCAGLSYSTSYKIIGDFLFLKKLIETEGYVSSNKMLVKMSGGGLSTSGIKSYMNVSKEFISEYRILGLVYTLFRMPLKLYLMLRH